MVVDWQITGHMRTSPVINVLEMTRMHGHLQPGAIVHYDRGTQYAFTAHCADIGVRVSMSRTRLYWNKTVTESFFATLKNEFYHRQNSATKTRTRFAVDDYTEPLYNSKHKNFTPGCRTLERALDDYRSATAAA